VSLCNPTNVQMLRQRFIAMYVSGLERADGAWSTRLRLASPEAKALVARIRSLYVQSPHKVQCFVLSPRGKLVWDPNMMMGDVDTIQPLLKRTATARVSPGPCPVARYRSRPPRPVEPGGLALRVVARYDAPPSLALLDELNALQIQYTGNPIFVHYPAYRGPARDWVILSPSEADGLLPPARAAVGDEFSVDTALAQRIVVHLAPLSSPIYPEPGQVTKVDLGGVVEWTNERQTLVRLRGSFRMGNPELTVGMHIEAPVVDWIEADIEGYLVFHTQTRKIGAVRIVTPRAFDCTPKGRRVGFKATAYSVSE